MNSIFPVMNDTLAARLEACPVAYSAKKLELLRALPDNPYKVHVRTFGNATALLVGAIDDSELSNRVGNMSGAELPYLDTILAWYKAHNVRCSFEIIPSHAQAGLLRQLAANGFYQSSFYTVLYGLPQSQMKPMPHITIRDVLPDEQDIFATIYLKSFSVPQDRTQYLRDSIRLLVGRPDLHCLFALINHEIAAMAVLYIHQQVGYLALAATLPSFRGRGCQKALLLHRIERASIAQCNLVVGQAEFASVSHQNAEKVGLRTAYTKADWTLF